MTTLTTDERSPAEIERSIDARREALEGKLQELVHRLSPTERLRELRGRIAPETVAPWAAVGAVATGAWLAARGLRRRHWVNGTPDDASTLEEIVCVDLAVPPNVAQ